MPNKQAFREFIIEKIKSSTLKQGDFVAPSAISQPFFGSTFNLSEEEMVELAREAALSMDIRTI